jgi:hypothetical protein
MKKYEKKEKGVVVVVFLLALPLEKKSISNCIFYQLKIKLTNIFPNHFSISFIIYTSAEWIT